jgi:hypothetical protein
MAQSLARNLIRLIFSSHFKMIFASFAAGMTWISMNGLPEGEVIWPFQGEGMLGDRPTQGVALG